MEKETKLKNASDLFTQLISLNVNEHTEQKNGLTYISWAWGWSEFKKKCPDATYVVKKFTNAITGETLPYLKDKCGYMVFTEVTANGLTHEMWLPVMDNANKTMKDESYTYTTGKGAYATKKTVESISMFDVNKTIMRCLVKNLAMFGLGLYIYAGEDLPEEIQEPITDEQIKRIKELKIVESNVCKRFKVSSIEELTYPQAEFVIKTKENSMKEGN